MRVDRTQLPGDSEGRDLRARCERSGCYQRADTEGDSSRERRKLRGLAGEGARDGQRDVYGQGADQRGIRCVGNDFAGSALRCEAAGCGRGRESFSGAGQNQWSYSYPTGSDVNSRGLTITVAPSVAGTVFDALDYLTGYPWGCTEQTMSSFLPDLIVAQAVDKLHLKSPIDRKTLDDEVQADWSGSIASSTTMADGAGGRTTRAWSS